MLGRSWMWPVPASPIFSWSSQTWSAWKLDEKQSKLYFKTHLPYSSENSTPQTYLQYILFKQPHGQDNLNHIIRSPNAQGQTPRLHCSEIIQLLILEAMCAMEDSDQPVLAPINQYNWLHLSHLVTFALFMGHCTLSDLLMMLLPQLKSCQYLRAKEELMWILLQYIAHTKSKERQAYQQQQQHQDSIAASLAGISTSSSVGVQNRELVLEIFNVLYTDKSMNWGNSCSTEQPLEMVRFFAPAAIWCHLVSSPSAAPGAEFLPQPQPPEKLRQLIDFIDNQLRDTKDRKQLEKNSALLAVIANAYSNNQDLFDEHVNKTVFPELARFVHQRNQLSSERSIFDFKALPSTIQDKWTLPGGRKTEPFLHALELTFLDSLTFHAKRQLYHFAIFRLQFAILTAYQQPSAFGVKLPSPALMESIARLLLSTELCDQNGARFNHLVMYALKPQGQSETKQTYLARVDLLTLLLELLNFRLQNIWFGWKWDIGNRTTIMFGFLEQISYNPIIWQYPAPNSVQLCLLLEQTVLRFAQCTFPQDMLITFHRYWHILPRMSMVLPEIVRAFILSAIRASKLLGDDLPQIAELKWQWPRADIQFFPSGLQQILYEQLTQKEEEWMNEKAQRILEMDQASGQSVQHLVHLDAEYFAQMHNPNAANNTQSSTLLISIFRCIYQFQLPNLPFPPPGKPPHPSTPNFFALCYKILGSLGNRELRKLANAFVEWLANKCAWLGQQETAHTQGAAADEYDLHHILKVLNDMLFSHHFITVERLLFAITLHPNDDQSIRTLLCLLAALLESKFSQLPERLHACYAFSPAHSQTTCSNSEEFFMQMAEYYKKYPEYSFAELYQRSMNSQLQSDAVPNLPVYYGHLAERICPLCDVLLQRAIALDLKPGVMDTLLCHFSPIYRIHPKPMTFLYTTLYTLEGVFLAHQQAAINSPSVLALPVRKFVLEIVLKLEQEEMPLGRAVVGKLLSTEFIQLDHQMPAVEFCRVLVERIVQASTYTHQPPQFVHSDWRFAEFPPAAQALTSAWVEILASRHSPVDIIEALVQLAILRPISRPQDTLNALGLLLTGLPTSFQCAFLDKVEQSFDWEQLSTPDADPAQFFESLSHEVYLHSESQILSMLALFHSFCQHGGNNSLNIIPDLIVQRLAPKVQNEAQLLYFLRIVVPYLQRIHEKERSRHMHEIVAIYEVLGRLTQKVGQLLYEDTICDLLYQFKYMFVGYLLKDQTEKAIRSFPESMREKLKFLLTHSSSATAATESQQQHMQQMLQQQQLLQHHPSMAGLLPGMPSGVAAAMAAHQQQQAGGQIAAGSANSALAGVLRRLSYSENEAAASTSGGVAPLTALLHNQHGGVIQGEQQNSADGGGILQFPNAINSSAPNSSSNPTTAQGTINSSTSFFPTSSSFNSGQTNHQQQHQLVPPPPPYPQQQQQQPPSQTSSTSIPPVGMGNVVTFPSQMPSTGTGGGGIPPTQPQFMMAYAQQSQTTNFQQQQQQFGVPHAAQMGFPGFQQQQNSQHLAQMGGGGRGEPTSSSSSRGMGQQLAPSHQFPSTGN